MTFAPLVVQATLVSRLVMASPIHLDALLMSAVAKRDDLPPLTTQREALCAPTVEIPIERSACGRYYLASAAIGEVAAHELRYVQKRFPMQEALALSADVTKRIDTNSGQCKAFRIPVEAKHIDTLTWYAQGDADAVRSLLPLVTRLGKRRSAGEGLVSQWTVSDAETWEGFPVLLAGRPLRNLPADAPGLDVCFPVTVGRSFPPYWLRAGEEEIAAPC